MADIAIIGGGHVGITLLADLEATKEMHGHRAMLFFIGCRTESLEQRIRPFRGQLSLIDVMEGRQDKIRLVANQFSMLRDRTTLPKLRGVKYIVITAPDIPVLRLQLMEALVRHVPLDGKVLILVRAGQGGQPVIAEMVRTRPELRETSIVLIEDSFYGTRVSGAEISFKRKLSVNASIYAPSTRQALREVRALFPLGSRIQQASWPNIVLRPGIDLLFDPLGYIIHAGVALHPPNIEKTRNGVRYNHYINGIDRALATKLDCLDHERVELAGKFGARCGLFSEIIERQYGIPKQSDLYEMMQSCKGVYRSLSCRSLDDLVNSRHVLEDMPALFTIEWLARCANLELPHTAKFARETRRALRQLGVSERQLRAYMPFIYNIPDDLNYVRELLNSPRGLSSSHAQRPTGWRGVGSVGVE